MAEDTKVIDVIMGPYRGHRLTVSAADAESAINNHWATDADALPLGPDDHPHPPLSDEERTGALDAANEWAKETWATAQGTEPEQPPPDGESEGGITRDMEGDEPGKYTTRGSAKPRRR